MGAITPVTYTTPDGIERSLRYTMGAARRIGADFGTNNLQKLLNQYDYACVPRLVYYCLFDASGNPPDGLTAAQFEEQFPGDNETGLKALSALMSAMSQGKASKNELEARMRTETDQPTGSESGPSASNASDSPTRSSGTLLSMSSTPSSSDTETSSDSSITERES
jgi:hypothetical protein